MHQLQLNGVAELTCDEMATVVGGDCRTIAHGIGYVLGWLAGEIVDGLLPDADEKNSFLDK